MSKAGPGLVVLWRKALSVMVRCSQSARERGLNPGINSPMSEYTQMPKVMMSSENLKRFQVVRV